MDEPTLSKTDHDIMTARGWDTENPATVSKYQDLREKVGAERITEPELTRQMNNFEIQQRIEGKHRSPEQDDLGRKPPDRGL